jgi:hypothetical protein
MEKVDQQRVAAQEARANDQAVLAGLREQLETARAEVSQLDVSVMQQKTVSLQ